MSTYSPRATVDLPSGEAEAQRIVDALGMEVRETKKRRELEDLDSHTFHVVRDALHEVGAEIEDFELLSAEYSEARVELKVGLNPANGVGWPRCPRGHGPVRGDGKCAVCGWDSALPDMEDAGLDFD